MPRRRRGDGNLYRRGKTWWLSYYANGERVRESAKTRDKEQAKTLLQTRIGQRAEGRLIVGADQVMFDELAEMLLRDYRVNERRSIRDATLRVEHLAEGFSGRPAQGISTADIQTYVDGRLLGEVGRRTKPRQRGAQGVVRKASPGEVNRELAMLKRAFRLGLQARRIAHMPHIPMLKEPSPRKGFFERDEFEAVLARLPVYLRPPMSFAYVTGWRVRSEVLPLSWDKVDLEAGTVRLDPGTTKNGDGRVIYLTDELQALLRGQWVERQAKHPTCPLVFHRDGEEILEPAYSWDKACREASLPGRLMHDMRRTAVRNMVRAGIPERVAMQMAGHKTRSVFDRYHIVADTDLREAATRLGDAFRSRTGTVSDTPAPSTVDTAPVTH